ncbi:GntR family transcriptional regulator [Salinicoccus halodurans]|uniref:GntR family transcriptional regulator n=1 Tax=Salinicoccus halodurans TaxID=407035 RepID=A0A0F7D4P9_9STAP|nr:GntR family transcriptional regulator [Salinicoccus halodurans]AKG74615.1 GntR family transcriptional regulator [Salinicoccus halodurans]SFK89190.1 transcriptional regulator, GntR family [Salinicoccus halodurans]
MNIQISNNTDIPIYEQLKNEIIRSIMTGEIKPGDSLMSMRALAKELKISIITTKRAYQDLEQEGYVYSVVGKGTFVSEQNASIQKERVLLQIEKNIEELLKTAHQIGLPTEELIDMIHVIEEDTR